MRPPWPPAAGPVGEAAARELPRRRLAALAFVLAVHPHHLAGDGVERDDGAARAGGGVDDAVDHQRRRLEVELGARAERVGLEAPRDLELVEVVFGDLVERRVPCAGQVAAVGRPLGALRLGLSAQGRRSSRRARPAPRSAQSDGVFAESCAASYRDSRRRQPASCTSDTSSTRSTSGAKRGRGADACCCGSRITIGSAAGASSRRRSSRISPGSGSRPTNRSSGRASGMTSTDKRSTCSGVRAWCTRAAAPRADDRGGAKAAAARGESESVGRASSAIPGTCRDRGLAEGPGVGLRVRLEPSVERFVDLRLGPQEQRPSEQCGDLLVRDRDGNWTYQFAATVDDHVQGVTLVIRGDRSAGVHRPADPARAAARPRRAAGVPAPCADHEVARAEAEQVGRRHRHPRAAGAAGGRPPR